MTDQQSELMTYAEARKKLLAQSEEFEAARKPPLADAISDRAELLKRLTMPADISEALASLEDAAAAIRELEATVLDLEGDLRVLRRRDDKLVAEIYELRAELVTERKYVRELEQWKHAQEIVAQLFAEREASKALEGALAEAREQNLVMRKGLAAVAALISDSSGVSGLHLNGDVAPWASLLQGGQFEEWLIDYCDAQAAIDAARGAKESPR